MSSQIAVHLNTIDMAPYTPNVMQKPDGSVRINGFPIITSVDIIPTHSRTSPTDIHTNATFNASDTINKFRVNNESVIIDGDGASCDITHTINASSGSVTFALGEE